MVARLPLASCHGYAVNIQVHHYLILATPSSAAAEIEFNSWHLMASLCEVIPVIDASQIHLRDDELPGLVQVVGVRLAPFVVEKENLLMAAMFHPLNEKLWIHKAIVTNVSFSCKWAVIAGALIC